MEALASDERTRFAVAQDNVEYRTHLPLDILIRLVAGLAGVKRNKADRLSAFNAKRRKNKPRISEQQRKAEEQELLKMYGII